MPPRVRGARGGVAAAAAAGRTSSRIAEKATAAQQVTTAQQTTTEQALTELAAGEAGEDAPNAVPDSSMPPPSTRGRGRGRPPRGGADGHARRGTTRRGSRSGNSIASFTPVARDSPTNTDIYMLQANGDQPFTPQRAEAANMVYGNIDPWREASELTPRTQNATRNLMSKSIDRLYALSKDLIGHLSIEGEERDESWIHELRFHKDVFTSFYSIYAQDADLFVDIDSVSETTKASEVPMLWERMIKGVSTANLARLLSDVEDLDGDPSNVLNRLPLLRKLDDNFPTVFTPGGPQGLEEHRHWVVDTATVDLAFAIRVQRFIETLRGVQEVSPIRHYATIFLNVDFTEFQDHEVEQFLDKAPLRDFAGFDINGPFTDTFRDALSSFRAMILERDEENVQADSNAIISKLEQEYAFDVFVRTLKDWVKAFDNKIPGLARPAYNGDSAFPADAQLQIDPASQQQQGRLTLSGIERLRQRMAASSVAPTSAQPNPASQSDSDLSFGTFEDREASLAETDAEMLARSRAAAAQAQYLMSNAEQGAMYAAAAAVAENAKRTPGRKRGRKPAEDGGPGPKRARAADAAAMSPSQVPPIELGPLPPASVAFDPVALSQRSQLISKANRRPAQPKQRKPWTAHDTQQLVRAVDVYKAKWSTIERAIRQEHIAFNVPERDQQGLRDKARLVKVDILKTDAVLPPGFDLVVLGRKEKEMVIHAGRNPERREEDMDAAGNVTNTLYDPDPPELMHQEVHQPAPEVLDVSHQDNADAAELRPLQEAQMVAEAPMGGAPDAPMGSAEMGAAVSEHLGEADSVVDTNMAPPIDPSIAETGSNADAVQV